MTIKLIDLILQVMSPRDRTHTPLEMLEELFKQQKNGVIQEMTLNERYCNLAKIVLIQERKHTQTYVG